MIQNPFLSQQILGSKNKTVIYIAPEDLRDKLSGGHIESLTDAYLLSDIYKKVVVIFPDENINNSNYLYKKISLQKNIIFKKVSKNKSKLYKFLLSQKRASYKEILSIIKSFREAHIFVGCHRNLLAHLIIYKTFGKSNLFFKSYGSIFLHNLDNLYAIARSRYFDNNFFKRFLSTIFYLFFEHFSYFFCKRIFITRDKKNVNSNVIGKFYDAIFGSKTIYKCSGPYWYFLEKESDILKKNIEYKNKEYIRIGSMGDNTFPTAILGMCYLLKELDEINKKLDKRIVIEIAGKSNSKSINTIKKIKLVSNIKINFLGYVEDKNQFLNSLDGILLPVSGGSAMPIKALEAMIKYDGPIFVTEYIDNSCSAFFKDNKNICNNASKFIYLLEKKY